MADKDHANFADHGQFWDREGAEWTTKWASWAELKQVAQLVGRDADVALIQGTFGDAEWLDHDQAKAWWQHAKHHFEVPGRTSAEADESGETWAGHIYRRGDKKLLVVMSFC